MIYVLAFDKLAQDNVYFDADDSTHLLLFLHLLFSHDDNSFWYKSIRNEFYQRMTNYSQELVSKNIESALDYILITED